MKNGSTTIRATSRKLRTVSKIEENKIHESLEFRYIRVAIFLIEKKKFKAAKMKSLNSGIYINMLYMAKRCTFHYQKVNVDLKMFPVIPKSK